MGRRKRKRKKSTKKVNNHPPVTPDNHACVIPVGATPMSPTRQRFIDLVCNLYREYLQPPCETSKESE